VDVLLAESRMEKKILRREALALLGAAAGAADVEYARHGVRRSVNSELAAVSGDPASGISATFQVGVPV